MTVLNLDDGSGMTQVYVDGTTGVNICDMGVQNGYEIAVIGFSTEFIGTYQVKPRQDSDIIIMMDIPSIGKSAPAQVQPAELFTYTVTVQNFTGGTMTNLVITDAVPGNAVFVQALDGGTETAGVVTWNVASLSDQDSVDVRFEVTAVTTPLLNIVNDQYQVTSTEFPTPTAGMPVVTSIFGALTIPEIQGDGFRSPYEGSALSTSGVVVGYFEGNADSNFDGFYIQDVIGDGDPATSDGIFVNHGSLNVTVDIGYYVVVTGTVQEFSEWDGLPALSMKVV